MSGGQQTTRMVKGISNLLGGVSSKPCLTPEAFLMRTSPFDPIWSFPESSRATPLEGILSSDWDFPSHFQHPAFFGCVPPFSELESPIFFLWKLL